MDMWPILETVLDCGSDCGGRGMAPPPKFMVPPPPRPPFMQPLKHCREEAASDGGDMCDAISMLDPNFLTESSLESSALIAFFSIALILIIVITSLFVWNLAQSCSCKRTRSRAAVSETYQCSCEQPYTRSILPLTANQCSCQRSNSSWSSTYYRPCTCQHCARANLALAYWSPKAFQQWQYTIE